MPAQFQGKSVEQFEQEPIFRAGPLPVRPEKGRGRHFHMNRLSAGRACPYTTKASNHA